MAGHTGIGASSSAVVFGGQGSQLPGMATPWVATPTFARWEEGSDLLGRDLVRLGTTAEVDELRQPLECQLALFVHHVVIWEAFTAAATSSGLVLPVVVAGHSLGEYAALVAASVLSFADALALVDVRARATQAAADGSPGRMVATLGVDTDVVRAAVADVGAHIANDNAPGQLTVSGSEDQLAALTAALAEQPGRVRPLAVGAAYHSPHMDAAVPVLAAALSTAPFRDATIDVVANVDAAVHRDAADWPDLLAAQVRQPVRWRESVLAMAALGIRGVVELGASAVLGPLVKRIDRGIARSHVTTPDQLAALVELSA